LSRFALEVGRAVLSQSRFRATLSVSIDNENYAAISDIGGGLLPLRFFSSNIGALAQNWRIPVLRRQLATWIEREQIGAVIELMPHVWSPFIMPSLKSLGVRYVSVIHDADAHPGDRSSLAKFLLDRAVDNADLVLTLSGAVAGRLEATERISPKKIFTLFHPDLHYGAPARPRRLTPGEPLRVLFLGRILHYKGLPILIDAVEQLRADGHAIAFGVFGEGPLKASADRLRALEAEVINRWLSDDEIAAVLGRYDVMVLPHVEASQSGVAATAFGAGLPVVCTPVGGLPEQVLDGVTGLVARRADGPALADAILRLARDPQLYHAISSTVVETREERSIYRFVDDCVAHARHVRTT
jgi:glycosyltransferase involved in cell wall biosynthesis